MSIWTRLVSLNAVRRERRRLRKPTYAGRHRGAQPSTERVANYCPGRHTATHLQSPEHKKYDIGKRIAETAKAYEVLERFMQSPCPHPSFDRPAPWWLGLAGSRNDAPPVRPMHFSYSRLVGAAG